MEKRKYTIRQLGEDLGHIDRRIVSVLEDHEARLQMLESDLDFRGMLDFLRAKVTQLPDTAQRVKALVALDEVGRLLGVKLEGLEAP